MSGPAELEREGQDEGDESEVEETEGQDEGQEDGDGEGQEDGEGRKPATDWEKRAHNHAGQAAREKSRRRAAEARNEELQTRLDALERRIGGQPGEDELLALIGQIPDTMDDPVGDLARIKQALKLYGQREADQGQRNQQQAFFDREVGKLRTAMGDAEADFAVDHPDYFEAAKFYRDARAEELRDAGYSGRFLDQKLADDLFGLVKMAQDSGQDPAERVYALAARRGFKTGAKKTNANLDKLENAAGTGVRPVARQAGGTLSWGDVAKLDGAARDKAWAKLREREKGRK